MEQQQTAPPPMRLLDILEDCFPAREAVATSSIKLARYSIRPNVSCSAWFCGESGARSYLL
jgi:hypothetical protein